MDCSIPAKPPAEAPRNIDKAVKENPRENLPYLIEYIRENSADEAEMFRYAHDWVAQNVAYDVEALRGESPKVTDAYGVLQYGKSVCAGYSNALQLLEEPLDFDDFISQPVLRGRFFTYGFRQRDEYKKITVVEEYEYELQFSDGPEMLMSARLVAYPDQSKEFQGYEMITRDSEGTHTVHVRFPEPARYRLMLFAKHQNDRVSYSSLGSYYFEATADAQGAGRESASASLSQPVSRRSTIYSPETTDIFASI